jgi:hypothetical protein
MVRHDHRYGSDAVINITTHARFQIINADEALT